MPLDATGFAALNVTTLGQIDFVPSSVVRKHKRQVLRDMKKDDVMRRRIHIGYAGWRSLSFGVRMLERPEDLLPAELIPPAAVRELASVVAGIIQRENYTNAVAQIEFFDRDPILNLGYDGKWHCLAIWDGDQVLHIASLTREAKPGFWQRLFRR